MDDTFTPITGAVTQETAEPGQLTDRKLNREPSTSASASTSTSTSASTATPTALIPPATRKTQNKRLTSAANSPIPSREPSPVRPPLKANASTRSTPGPGRSRKNSTQEVSPARSASASTNPPNAVATQRALSVASTPILHPITSDPTIRAPVPQKGTVTTEVKETPRWPISPRLRSPPPVNKPPIIPPRKIDQELPSINVQSLPQQAEQKEGKQGNAESETEDLLSIPGMRTPARGVSGTSSTLETVQEISQPSTPSEFDSALEKVEQGSSQSLIDQDNSTDNASTKTIKAKPAIAASESGSESGGKGDIKMRSTCAVPQTTARPNGPSAKPFTGVGRGKPSGEGSTRNMTVETETVSSIPQIAVGGPAGAGNNGSIRTKPSSETIRPKKEKKKTARKAPSVTSGTGEQKYLSGSRTRHHHHHSTREGSVVDSANFAPRSRSPERIDGQGPFYRSISPTQSSSATSPSRSVSQASRRPSLNLQAVGTMLIRSRPASSKADIFEAKVASAVDEANSSDSEETFVYESNPPEASERPRRFHSRTPSATSMASQIDQRNGVRTIMDGHHSVAMKKSMKFANSYNSTGQEQTTGEDDGKGTARSNVGTGRGTTHHHHIGGRWSRNGGGNGHPSLFDNESPFPNATKQKTGNSPRQPSQPSSPRMANTRMAGNGKRASPIHSAYDLDDGADDERTPLVSTVRTSRSGRGRRQASSMRQLEHQASRHDRSFLARFAGCLVLAVMITLVLSGVIGFTFATTQALTDVKIIALKNIIASEQDVILDMKVQARNPNLVVVSIDTTDLVIFAKSKYAGTDSEWWKHPSRADLFRRGLRRRDDDPLDPPLSGGGDNTSPNLVIGHVYAFYSPLTFEGSPFHAEPYTSLGQIRIDHPGNDTSPSGSERWGRVVQHEFDLIVRGTLKYTLPLSPKVRSVSVEARVTVKPNAADQDPEDIHVN
ncbi:related to vacuolar protein VAC7 [Rhynchosporium agropyri]|uniref:Related to vacuolar protein VAC7 n=1 Tax=Rhynchosporium agropyri TaxID=914238 RepID=A0A1E1KX10_9HELO|nr:related to vacuolar protein VAC7 [Rhynchosporium agropyri]